MESISANDVLVKASSWGIATLITLFKLWWNRKRISQISCCVIPSCSGKTQLVSDFKKNFDTTQHYLLDIEDLVFQDPKIPTVVKTQLIDLKKTDPVLFQARFFPLVREFLVSVLEHLKATKERNIIVLVSSRELQKYLGIRRGYNFAPTKLLSAEIVKAHPEFEEYIEYCRSILQGKEVVLYNEFKDLITAFSTVFQIKKSL